MPSDPSAPDPTLPPAPDFPPPGPRARRRVGLRRVLAFTVVMACFPVLWIVNARTPPPRNLGVRNGLFRACPESPNCVNSQSRDDVHGIAPISFSGSADQAKQQLKEVIAEYPRARLLRETEEYLRYEFRTRFLMFGDDVEFNLDPLAKVIHVRSASRLGYSDLGTNRRRVEELRRKFGQRSASTSASPAPTR